MENLTNGAVEMIKRCEELFEAQLDEAAERMIGRGDRIITLSGPSCSGKTTASAKLISALENAGKRVCVISIDDFYFDRDTLIKRSEKSAEGIDFDSPRTIDFAALSRCFDKIVNMETVYFPVFDFKKGKRSGSREIDPHSVDTFVFEGIQALYNEFTDMLSGTVHTSLFISPESKIEIGETVFLPEEIRLTRRLVRDKLYRSSSPEFTLKLWQNVRKNELIHIFPNRYKADIIIDSTLAYEPLVMKPKLLALAGEIGEGCVGYEALAALAKKYETIQSVPDTLVPSRSLFREFI